MKIFIAIFQKIPSIKSKEYVNLQLGAFNNKKITEYIDSSGDNISLKNQSYCELTGLYWIWKNISEDIVGLVHYRRFFYRKTIIKNKLNVLKENEIKDILKDYDIILPYAGHLFGSSVYKQYKNNHDIDDLKKCRDIIQSLSPEYLNAFDDVIYSSSYHPFNMFIAKKELMDSYCEWLFSILFALEKKIDLNDKDKYNKRVYGFLGERLFNVWLRKNKLRIKELPVYNTELPMLKQIGIVIIKKILRGGK